MDLRRARFQKGRRWKTVPVGQKSLMKEVEDITAGTVTGSKGCPDPFAPATPRFTASSLGNSAIDHHKPNCLFRNVVGGLDVRRRDEFKVCFSPFEGSFGHTEERVQIGAEAPRPATSAVNSGPKRPPFCTSGGREA